MNICQISSLDLIHCLQSDRPSAMSFFQQVLTIAQEDHLVSISDYAISQFLAKSLHPIDQKQLETLLDAIDIWTIDPSDLDRALDISESQGIAFADAIDQIIYESLCPDWILVNESPRNLPNATAIENFWQDWQAIRDDLPPNGGITPRFPSGGGGSPSGTTNDTPYSNVASATKQTPSQDTAINSSIIFSQNSFVNLSWSLLSGSPSHSGSAANNASTPISLSENRPIAAIQLAQAIQDALPTLEVQLQQTSRGWEVVIELPTGEAVQTIALADLAHDRRTVLKQIQAQVQSLEALIPNANLDALIAQAVQNIIARSDVAGNDIIFIRDPKTAIDGGDGIDLVSYRNAIAGVTIDLASDQLLQSVENLEGSQFADQLLGDQTDNVIIALAGNDTIIGSDGNDILQSNAGDNLLIGGRIDNGEAAAPTLVALVATPESPMPDIKTIDQSPINSTGLDATSNPPNLANPDSARDDDWIFAGNGNDVINAGDGNNYISAGTGDNYIYSGDGIDLFVLEAGNGLTHIMHYQKHDKFGLVGGYSYDDLVLTDAPGKQAGTRIQLKPTQHENGDILAIVFGVTPAQLDRSDFLTIAYAPAQLPQLATTESGLTQQIPDWLTATQQAGQTLYVPSLRQLAPTICPWPNLEQLHRAA